MSGRNWLNHPLYFHFNLCEKFLYQIYFVRWIKSIFSIIYQLTHISEMFWDYGLFWEIWYNDKLFNEKLIVLFLFKGVTIIWNLVIFWDGNDICHFSRCVSFISLSSLFVLYHLLLNFELTGGKYKRNFSYH